jgi:hypothetical protein
MTRTPDEIKKGLRWCGGIAQIIKGCSGGCPYYVDDSGCASEDMHADALALIQQLQAENAKKDARIQQLEDHLREDTKKVEQLEAERDKTISILRLAGCDTCKYREVDSWEEPCLYCMNRERWEWSGVQKEDSDA